MYMGPLGNSLDYVVGIRMKGVLGALLSCPIMSGSSHLFCRALFGLNSFRCIFFPGLHFEFQDRDLRR